MKKRGSDRLSGLCGRLKCCLGFESKQYKDMLKSMLEIGEVVKIGKKRGMIVDRNILTKEITVEFEDKSKKKMNIDELEDF